MIKTTNKYMKRICSALAIPMATTQIYLADFAIDEKRKWAANLGAFGEK